MKYALGINIICNDQPSLDAVAAEIPVATDPSLWQQEYGGAVQELNMDGNKTLVSSLSFNNDSDRITVEEAIIGVAGVLTGCESGTRITLHDCNHDGSGGCVETMIYEVL